MNEFCKRILGLRNGGTLTLEPGRVYDVRQDDSFFLTGYFCSNSAARDENPDGRRYSAVYLKGLRDVTLDGAGATLMVHGKMTPFLLDGCENVTVKNLTIDYACPTMAEFFVLSRDDDWITLRINDECLFRVEGAELYWRGEDDLSGKPYWEDSSHGRHRLSWVYDSASQMYLDDVLRPEALTFTDIRALDDRTLRCRLADPGVALPAGRIVQSRNIVRDQVGAMLQRCKNVVFENLRVRFMHGLGMVSQFCENVSYIGCDMTPREGRTIAATADFLHFSGCRGRILVQDCRFSGAQDDPINVHGTHLRVVAADPAQKTITARFCHKESWGFQAVEAGDELEFVRWDTLRPYAGARVTGWEKLNDTDVLIRVTAVPEGLLPGKDVVENATWTPELTVRGCAFGPVWGRGVLATTRKNVLIERCRFEKCSAYALYVADDCNFWFESGYTENVVFRDNEVSCCNYCHIGDGAPLISFDPQVMDENAREYVHGRLAVTGNRFTDAPWGRHTFLLQYLREAEIANNTFDAPYEITTKVCGAVTDRDNTVSE